MQAQRESTAIALLSLNINEVNIMMQKHTDKSHTARFVIPHGSLDHKSLTVTLMTFKNGCPKTFYLQLIMTMIQTIILCPSILEKF
jgi:hypothetical protein